jgi:predicted component of type VI protein secretion system
MSWPKTQNKYGNHKVTLGGLKFDSKKEAERYFILKDKEKRGEISHLARQVKFTLIPHQREEIDGEVITEQEWAYFADFVYRKDGKLVVEDVKGYRNPSDAAYRCFVHCRKMMLQKYKIKVKEI